MTTNTNVLLATPGFDEQMLRLSAAASRLHFPPDRRIGFRIMAQAHMLQFVKPADLRLICQSPSELQRHSNLLARRFLQWHGVELWEPKGSLYSLLGSAEEDPMLQRALEDYFSELLQLPIMMATETDSKLSWNMMA